MKKYTFVSLVVLFSMLVASCSVKNGEAEQTVGMSETDLSIETTDKIDESVIESTEVISSEEIEATGETEQVIKRDQNLIDEAWNSAYIIPAEDVKFDAVKISVIQKESNENNRINEISVSDAYPELSSAVKAIVDKNNSFINETRRSEYKITRFDSRVLSFYHFGLHSEEQVFEDYEGYTYKLDGTPLALSDVITDFDLFEKCAIPYMTEYTKYRTDDVSLVSDSYKDQPWVLDVGGLVIIANSKHPEYNLNCFGLPYRDFADLFSVDSMPCDGEVFGSTNFGSYYFGDNVLKTGIGYGFEAQVVLNDKVFDFQADLQDNVWEYENPVTFFDMYILNLDNKVYAYIPVYGEYEGIECWAIYELTDGTPVYKLGSKGFLNAFDPSSLMGNCE